MTEIIYDMLNDIITEKCYDVDTKSVTAIKRYVYDMCVLIHEHESQLDEFEIRWLITSVDISHGLMTGRL